MIHYWVVYAVAWGLFLYYTNTGRLSYLRYALMLLCLPLQIIMLLLHAIGLLAFVVIRCFCPSKGQQGSKIAQVPGTDRSHYHHRRPDLEMLERV